jgi:hypothetical protein
MAAWEVNVVSLRLGATMRRGGLDGNRRGGAAPA